MFDPCFDIDKFDVDSAWDLSDLLDMLHGHPFWFGVGTVCQFLAANPHYWFYPPSCRLSWRTKFVEYLWLLLHPGNSPLRHIGLEHSHRFGLPRRVLMALESPMLCVLFYQ